MARHFHLDIETGTVYINGLMLGYYLARESVLVEHEPGSPVSTISLELLAENVSISNGAPA